MEETVQVAKYCYTCVHRTVCKYTGNLKQYEDKNSKIGTSTDWRATPITIICSEKLEIPYAGKGTN